MSLPPQMVDFSKLFLGTFLGSTTGQSKPSKNWLEHVYTTQITIPKGVVVKEALERFLRILQWTVTIADNADESHALYLHSLPHPTKDQDNVMWRHTRMGKLVNKAKSYSPTTGSKPAAQELAKRIEYWLERHPRYKVAHVIIPAPPGNKKKVFDLPLFVAQHLSKEFKIPLGSCTIVGEIQPQKEVELKIELLHANVVGKFKVEQGLTGKTVLAFDDIYRSGQTMNELVRACRAAGATAVLCLAATKTPRFCSGMSASDWYEVSMEAEKAPEENTNA